ncbi:TetR/AcrR family transcriptional regulator [Microtetraspora malaysiensis]|uniref:TetR/AcrR family transcriptional regulator n=1 Tax=Microtetraspora malaysiensis TaxID=161358 RepID=UPI003D8EFE38
MSKREALIVAAHEAIAEKGFEGLRLRAVAARAGIDHSTLHHYFGTKQDLVDAVVDHATGQVRTGTSADGSREERLCHHLGMVGTMIAQRPELHIVLRELDLRSLRDPRTRATVAAHEEGWRSSLAGFAGAEVELIIATVKGASLCPEQAPAVLKKLCELLRGGRPCTF